MNGWSSWLFNILLSKSSKGLQNEYLVLNYHMILPWKNCACVEIYQYLWASKERLDSIFGLMFWMWFSCLYFRQDFFFSFSTSFETCFETIFNSWFQLLMQHDMQLVLLHLVDSVLHEKGRNLWNKLEKVEFWMVV